MMGVYNIAVLECDTPVDAVLASRGTYGDIFRDLLVAGLKARDPGTEDLEVQVSKWDVVNTTAFPHIDETDAILVSGSKHTAFRDDPWIVRLVERVKDVLQNSRKPVVGICFGHQILGRALGAAVGTNSHGWEISVSQIDLNNEGQRVLGTPRLSLHQMHKDAVLEVPNGVVNIGSSPTCAIQGFYKRGSLFSFQAHPEFDESIMQEVLKTRRAQHIFDNAIFEDGTARAGEPHGGLGVASAIWRFLLDNEPRS